MRKLTIWRHVFSVLIALRTLAAPLVAGVPARSANRQQLRTIEKHMDATAEPCEDFYQYACGNWETVHGGNDYSETIGYIDNKVDHEFGRILNTLRKQRKPHQHKFVNNVVNYYRSCMAVREYSPFEYLKWLKEHEHLKWPRPSPHVKRASAHGSHKSKTKFDWLHMLATLRKYGLNGVFIEESVIQKSNNARASAIDIDKPVLNGGFQPMPYKGFQIIMEYCGVDERQEVDKLWDEMHFFERTLQSLDYVDESDSNDIDANVLNQVSLAELKMPWLERYLSIVLEEPVHPHMNITIQNLPYIRALLGVISEYEPEFICRYLMMRFLWYLNIDGPRNFLKLDCISHTRSMMPMAMHWLYEEYNSELLREKEHVELLFQELIQHFKHTLATNANRFDANILQFLQDKVNSMRIKISNLPRPNTTAQLEAYYEDLRLDPSEFYINHLHLLRFYTKAKHQRLKTLVPEGDAFFHIEDPDTGASSSPYYLLRSNVIIVPLTVLHPPIYHSQMHDIFKYSSLGFLLSHEITHGFDDSGVEFDQQGNMLGPSKRIKANSLFDSNLECLRSKNPQIIDEKIADVSGLRWAYEAYFKNISDSGAQRKSNLSFTDLSPRRLFFLNFVQFFCGSPDGGTARDVDFSEHGTDRQRVLDALAHFGEFGRVYECPVGSRLHPERKCQLWR